MAYQKQIGTSIASFISIVSSSSIFLHAHDKVPHRDFNEFKCILEPPVNVAKLDLGHARGNHCSKSNAQITRTPRRWENSCSSDTRVSLFDRARWTLIPSYFQTRKALGLGAKLVTA